MTDKTDDQIAAERAAVEAMKGAKSNMAKALERIDTLERALGNARYSISELKKYISPTAYTYPVSGQSKPIHSVADDAVAAIAKVLS